VKFIARNQNFILLTIGIMLVILSLCLIFYDRFELLKDNVFNEIDLVKYQEKNKDNVDIKDEDEKQVITSVETENIDENDASNGITTNNNINNTIKKEYIGYLKIDKIHLNQGLVSKNSYYNNVDYNIQILKDSDYPDKEQGNVILAAHSGSGSISYFKNLYQLGIQDEALIYYKGYIYKYKLVNIYNVIKNGTVEIKRDNEKSVLTLITCTHNSNTEQTVYILELISKKEDV